MKKLILAFLIIPFVITGAQAQVLYFQDTYTYDTAVGGDTQDVNTQYNTVGRQTGTTAPLTYTQSPAGSDFTHQLNNPGSSGDSSPLLMASIGGAGAQVSPNYNFNLAGPLLRISLQVNPNADGSSNSADFGVTFGASTQNQGAGASPGVEQPGLAGFLLNESGGYEAFNNGVLISPLITAPATEAGSGLFSSLVFTLTAVDGISNFDGNGSLVTIMDNDDTLYSFSANFTDNYISLIAYNNDNGQLSVNYADNLTIEGISAVPEPSTAAMILGGFALLIGFQKLRKRTL